MENGARMNGLGTQPLLEPLSKAWREWQRMYTDLSPLGLSALLMGPLWASPKPEGLGDVSRQASGKQSRIGGWKTDLGWQGITSRDSFQWRSWRLSCSLSFGFTQFTPWEMQ